MSTGSCFSNYSKIPEWTCIQTSILARPRHPPDLNQPMSLKQTKGEESALECWAVTETSFLLSTEAQAGSSDQRAIWGWGRSLSCVSIPSLSALHPPKDNWKWRHFLLKECVISNRPSLGPALKAGQTRWECRWSGNLSPEGINDFRNNSDCCSLGHGKSPQLWSGRPSSSWDDWNFFLWE